MDGDAIFESGQAFVAAHWPWALLAAGVWFLLGAIMGWNWLCDPKGTRSAYGMFGRTGRRITFGVGGAVLLIIGAWMLLF